MHELDGMRPRRRRGVEAPARAGARGVAKAWSVSLSRPESQPPRSELLLLVDALVFWSQSATNARMRFEAMCYQCGNTPFVAFR